MKIWKSPLTRRNLMQTFGQAAIVLPFMRLLEEEQLYAATPVTRAIFWYFPDGIIKPFFHPSGDGADFPAMTQPLQRLRGDVSLIRNANYRTEGSHEGGAAYCLTGYANGRGGASIDSILGERFQASSQLPVLRLGVGANFQRNGTISYIAPGIPAVIEDHPARAFYALFGGSQTPIDPKTREQIIRGEKSILDLGMNQLRSLESQLGSLEQQKLSVHVEALRELERRVQDAGQIGSDRLPQCTETVDMRGLRFPDNDYSYPSMEHRNEHFATVGAVINDIALQALACGLTRVLLLQWSHPVSPTQFDFPGGVGLARGHHDLSHYGGDPNSSYARDYVSCQRWYMDRLAQFLDQLKAIPVGDKNLLYHTALLALTEIADSNLHDFQNVGLVLAGQASGRMNSGLTLDAGGASHNQVLVSMMQAMGQSDETLGDPLLGRGPIKGLIRG